MWGKFAKSQAKSQVTESLYEVKTARTQQTTELMQVRADAACACACTRGRCVLWM